MLLQTPLKTEKFYIVLFRSFLAALSDFYCILLPTSWKITV